MIKAKYLKHIHPSLHSFAVRVDSLTIDPKNTRKHPKKNLLATKQSLDKFGQVLPIIARKDSRVITVGNGRTSIFVQKGWKYIACLFADLTEDEARMLSIADNRTGELAQWDYEALQLAANDLKITFPDVDLSTLLLGFDAGDLEPILRAEFAPGGVTDFGEDTVEVDKLRVSRNKLTVAGDVKKYGEELHKLLIAQDPKWKGRKLSDVIVYVLRMRLKKMKRAA